MSSQQSPTASVRPSRWAVDLVERLGIADEAGPHWENKLRVAAGRRKVDVRCPQDHLIARCGLVPPHLGGGIELFKGQWPDPRRHSRNAWLTISRITWPCPRCSFSQETTRQALQDAIARAVAAGHRTVMLGLDL